MTRIFQTSEEMIILDLFMELYPDFPKGRIIKAESPDFIIRLNTKRSLGIEITRLQLDPDEPPVHGIKELIEKIIQRKDDKLHIYQRKKIDRYWLILVNGVSDDNAYHIPEKIYDWNLETRFNKLFIFDMPARRIYEIK
jgi:hypothetical protein